jgi:hypothetical protein
MSRARDLADLGGSADAGGLTGRNLIINGAMTISQRGDSTGVTSTGYYGPDRYQLTLSSLGTWSISQSSTAPSGFGNSYKLEATTNDASPAASDYAIFLQKFEGQNLQQLKKGIASAESVTLSFWVRSSKTGTYIVELFDNDNSRSISASYTISVADTFEYKTITFAGDTTGAFDDDNASSLELIWWLAAGTDFTSGTLNTSWGTRTNANIAVGQVNMADTANATWYITGVQLEVGDTATDFEHENYGTMLAKCMRYCEIWTLSQYRGPAFQVRDTTHTHGYWPFKVQKRSAPTVTFSGSFGSWQANSNTSSVSALTSEEITVDGSGISTTTSGMVAGNASLFVGNASNPTIKADAEL